MQCENDLPRARLPDSCLSTSEKVLHDVVGQQDGDSQVGSDFQSC